MIETISRSFNHDQTKHMGKNQNISTADTSAQHCNAKANFTKNLLLQKNAKY